MAEQRAYQDLFTSVERRSKELIDYVQKEDSIARIAKSKNDKLLSDFKELKQLGEAYVATVTNNAETAKIYSGQSELLAKVEQALEGASEFLDLEAFKVGLMEKSQEVETHCKSVCTKVTAFQKRVVSLKARGLQLSKASYDVLNNELISLDSLTDSKAEVINYLIINDLGSKTKYETFQTQLAGFSEQLLDLKLEVTALFESQVSTTSSGINITETPSSKLDTRKVNYSIVSEPNLNVYENLTSSGSKIVSETSNKIGLSLDNQVPAQYGTSLAQISLPQTLPQLPGTGYVSSGQTVIMSPGSLPNTASLNYSQIQAPAAYNYASQAQQINTGANYAGLSAPYAISSGCYNVPQSVSQGPGLSHAANSFNPYLPRASPVGSLPRLQIEKIKPPVFDGNICNYPAWKKRWKELITPGVGSECEELFRMQDAMGPKGLASIIKSFQNLAEAWDYLDDQYGRAEVAAI